MCLRPNNGAEAASVLPRCQTAWALTHTVTLATGVAPPLKQPPKRSDRRNVLPVLPVTDKRIMLPVTDKRIVLPVTDKRIMLPVTEKESCYP